MYIGKLNDRLDGIRYELTKRNLKKAPTLKENGNPFLGERLSVDWSDLISSGIDMYITLPGDYIINNIVIYLGEKSTPASISVYTKDKERLLYRYQGETKKAITEKVIPLSIEQKINDLVIEADVDFSDIVFENIEVYGACLEGENLFPSPLEYAETAPGKISVTCFSTVSADCPEGMRAAEILTEKLEEVAAVRLQAAVAGNVRFATDKAIAANGYQLTIEAQQITIAASDLKGFIQGAETLLKLIDGGMLPQCTVKDAHFVPFRGVHLYLPSAEEMDFAKRLVKYLLSPMGYNYIIMEIAGMLQFDSHPEINEAVMMALDKAKKGEWPSFPHGGVGGGTIVSKELASDFADYARSWGIDVIPEIQSLGHVQFMTLAHPDIAERPAEKPAYKYTDARLEDVPPSDFYAHSFCPSNPKSYEILFDLADEIIDTIRPTKYVHMGHDEVYQIGICPVCKDKNPADLFAEDVNRLHDYLSKKGLTMMIWSDMLQPCSRYLTPPAIDRVPKDVVMLDFIWYFHLDKDIEDNLLPHGFDVIYGNMYSSHFPRYETRIRKEGIKGAQVSAWAQTKEYSLAKEGKLYDFLFSAQMMWSSNYTRHARYSYDKVVSALIPTLREQLENVKYPSLAASACEQVIVDKGAFDPKAETGGEYAVGAQYNSLVFEHATNAVYRRLPWVDLDVIGHYVVTYQDGSEVQIPVTYAGNVSWWNRRHNEPFPNAYYRHNGYSATWYTDAVETETPDGQFATLYRYEWLNPKPCSVIEKVTYVPADDAETFVILNKLIGVK